MKLVIDIPESTYKVFKQLSRIIGVLVYEKDILTLIKAVKNGTPLPKGYGRLIDADKLISSFPNYDGVSDVIKTINYTDTIIDADKESEE